MEIGGGNMKILVCENKHCKDHKTSELLEELKNYDLEFSSSSCMDMCEGGPNIFTFPDLKMYGKVDKNRLEDIINHKAKGLEYNEEIYSLEDIKKYSFDPMHRRTVKLFRWHLEKHDDMSLLGLEEIIRTFQIKYDVYGNEFFNPIKVVLINTIKGPNLSSIINYLGKNSTMKVFDEFLKKSNQ